MSAEHASPQRPDRQPSRPTQGKEAGKAPYQSEDLLREIVEQATDLIALTDAQGVITFASSASRSLFQCAPEEMYGRHFTEFLEESAVPTALAAFRGGRKRGPMVTGLGLTMKRKDGSTFFGELNASPLAVGEQKGSLVFIRDITERVRAKEMLRESETRARAMLSAIPDLMFRSDSHGVLLDYKGPMSDLYVQSDQTITGKRLLDIMPPEFADLVDLQIRDTLESGTLQVFEYQLPIPGRGMRDYEARMVASGADEVMTIVRDITERKQAAESLQKLTQKDEEALSIARMGHWELDMTTAQFTFNDQYYSLHGTTAEEAGGYVMSVERFRSRYVHPDDAALIGEAIRRISETNDPNVQLQQEARILRADGEVRDIDVWLRGEKDSQGRITKIRGVNQDVTERKRGETELVIANKELLFENEEKEKRAAELVLANDETVRRLQDIQALHKIDQAIAGSLDLNLTLNVVLEQVKTRLNIDAAAVLLLNRHTQMLEFTSGLGFRSKAIERSRLRLGEGQSGRAALERRTVSVTDLLEDGTQFDRAPLLADEGFAAYFGTPLIAKGQVNGVLEVYHRSLLAPDENWLEFFRILAGQAAIAVDSAGLFTDLIHSNAELFAAYDSTIEGWSHALDLRDKETEGHTQRVTEMALRLARAAGITEEELPHVRRGALLHDIGKMGVPDNILLKPGKLTDEEWVVMRKHPTFAFELLSPIAYLRPAIDIPYCHHEKWDGSGYPRGLKGEQTPLATRLFAIADVWDALRSDRPYRQGWSKERVSEHIKSLSGTHFEPKAVELFLNTVNEDGENAG